MFFLSLPHPRRTRREEAARRDGIAEAIDWLRAEADTHRDGAGEAIRRTTLRRAANDLDATIGRHAQRRADQGTP
ncbi:MAG: hypothetical protein CMF72_24600 [Mameliella sp.]|nr:hypothetical protein [Mameliella sp.]|tara:strand:- start:2584 stop:2808 length:225 start_codon:yes stop_codon:yes gene_type:complete